MIGFNTQEIPVGEKTVIDVTLLLYFDQLEDVVVVAFGTQKKKEVVGVVTRINQPELKVLSSNLIQPLMDGLAGWGVIQHMGEQGEVGTDFFTPGVREEEGRVGTGCGGR